MLAIVLFAVLAAILLWFLVGTKGKWWAKVPLILVLPFLGFAFHSIPDTYKGWPTVSAPPLTSTFVSGIVEEPDPATGDEGAIYIWLIPVKGASSDHGLGYTSKTGEPRSYELPYSRELHKQVDKANGITKKGGTVQAQVTRPKGTKTHAGARTPKFLIRLYDLPPGLPPKTAG